MGWGCLSHTGDPEIVPGMPWPGMPCLCQAQHGHAGDAMTVPGMPCPYEPSGDPGCLCADPIGTVWGAGGVAVASCPPSWGCGSGWGTPGTRHHPPPPRPMPRPSRLADEPSIAETGCPARRLWVEGTPAELACAASGNPPPRVTCDKLGDNQDPPPVSPNVTRAHAGTYQCRATNTHGSALRNVTVAVECECGERRKKGASGLFLSAGGWRCVCVCVCGFLGDGGGVFG